MSPEEKELLKRSIALAEENNDILRKLQRSMRFQRIASIVYWLFILGSLAGVYYFIQPYIQSITDTYGGAKSSFSNNVNGLLENFKGLNQ